MGKRKDGLAPAALAAGTWILAWVVWFAVQLWLLGTVWNWDLGWADLLMSAVGAGLGATILAGMASALMSGLHAYIGWPRFPQESTKSLNAWAVAGLSTTLWVAITTAMSHAVLFDFRLPFFWVLWARSLHDYPRPDGWGLMITLLTIAAPAGVLGTIGLWTVAMVVMLPALFRKTLLGGAHSRIAQKKHGRVLMGLLAILLSGVWSAATIALDRSIYTGWLDLGVAGLFTSLAMISLAALTLVILRAVRKRS